MAKTIEQLKAQGAEVKNATVVGENTATRVGTLFTDIVEYIEQVTADGSTTTAKLAPLAVTTEKIANGAVTGDKIAAGTITEDNIEDKSLSQNVLANDAVSTSIIQDGAVTSEKLADSAMSKAMTNAITEETVRAETVEGLNRDRILNIETTLGIPINAYDEKNQFIRRGDGVIQDIGDTNPDLKNCRLLYFNVKEGLSYDFTFTSGVNLYCAQYCFYDGQLNPLGDMPRPDGLNNKVVAYTGIVAPERSVYLCLGTTAGTDYTVTIHNEESFSNTYETKMKPITCYYKTNTELTGGTTLKIGEDSYIKDNYDISVNIEFEIFDNIKIWKGNTQIYKWGYIEINNTTIKSMSKAGDLTFTTDHNLSISKYLHVYINVDNWRNAILTITTDKDGVADTFTCDIENFYAHGTLEIQSDNNTYKVNIAKIAYMDLGKKIRVYGDSYFQKDYNRFPYYVCKRGGNFLLNSLPGGNSAKLFTALQNDIKIGGMPRIIVWGLGMNDAGDVDENTPNTTWLNYVMQIIKLCANETELVLCTLPAISSKSHAGKNKWIRNSGFRYIDLSEAVAENDGDTSWRTGMAGNTENGGGDYHPSPYGAMVMADRAIMDLPELILRQ